MKHLETPSDLILTLWRSGQRDFARDTERATRAANPKVKLASCSTEEWLDKFITVNPVMLEMKETVRKLQPENDPVLIFGPTGTGKELIAHALHGSREGKFIAVNCTALPSELLESELFGHKKGAFTGASDDRVGKFRAAWKGTLFLDEIGDMPLDMQAKLLRVLQENSVCPLGSDREEIIECRVVAATNMNLRNLVDTGMFRLDLYHRLSVFEINLTSLDARLEDIEHIIDYLGGNGLVTAVKDNPKHEWNLEGNVRSLQAQIRRWLVLGKSN